MHAVLKGRVPRGIILAFLARVQERRALSLLWQRLVDWTEETETNLSPSREQVAQVADRLSAEMALWQVEASLESKTIIATHHRHLHAYRGYLLCADHLERTFLIDTRYGTYVRGKSCLLSIDGLEQARRFVDVLYLATQRT